MEQLCMTHFNALPNFKKFIQIKWLIISLRLSYKFFFLTLLKKLLYTIIDYGINIMENFG
jgi:hypothetical protein